MTHDDIIKLSSDSDERDDDKVFYYVDGIADLQKLVQFDNGEDFDVINTQNITFYPKSLYLGEDISNSNQQDIMTIEQVQEKAVKLFGNNFVFDFWNETEPGTKIDQIDLGGMPDTITIDKLVIKDGKLSLYSDDLAGDIDLQTLDAVDISMVDASLGDIKEYLSAHQQVETPALNPVVENLLKQVRSGEAGVNRDNADGRYVLTVFDKDRSLGYERGFKDVTVGEDLKEEVYISIDNSNAVTASKVPTFVRDELLDYAKGRIQLASNEQELVALIGKGQTFTLSEPATINVDELVAKDVIDSITVADDGSIALNGRRIDESGASASYSLEGRDEYDLNDIDIVLDAVKWDLNGKQVQNTKLSPEANHDTAEKPYRISIGTDDRPGGVEGEFHVQFVKEINAVSFKEMQSLAEELGGSARIMNNQEWADFYDESSAVKFADKVVAMNAERIVAGRENAGNERRDQLRTLLGDVIGAHGLSIDIKPTDIGNHTIANFLMNNNGTILFDGQVDGSPVMNRILDIDHLSIASAQFLMNSINSAQSKIQGQKPLLPPLTDEQWKKMSELGYPYAPGNAKADESAPIPEMVYWRVAAGMISSYEAVHAFANIGYTVGEDPARTTEILTELNDKYGKLDKYLQPLSEQLPVREGDNSTLEDILNKDDKFRYMLLSRMQSDVKYFLGNGNRHEPDLWGGNVENHLNVMYKLWDSLPEKPEWLTREQLGSYAQQMRHPSVIEQISALKKELKDILVGADLEHSPLTTKMEITLKSPFNSNVDRVLRYATFEDDRLHLYEKIEDAFDERNYEVQDILEPATQLQVLTALTDYYRNENNKVTKLLDTQNVPSYALPAIINGDFSGIDSEEDAKDIRAFMEREYYKGAIFSPRNEHRSFTTATAFGLPTDCVTVDILRTGTIKQFRDEHIAASQDLPFPEVAESVSEATAEMISLDAVRDAEKTMPQESREQLSERLWSKLNELLPENGDMLLLKQPFTITEAEGLAKGQLVDVFNIRRALSPEYDAVCVFVCGDNKGGVNTYRLTADNLHKVEAILENKDYTLSLKKDEGVEPELREARGYLMDVISQALKEMNGHIEISHTQVPSVPIKGDWKEEGDGHPYMEVIKSENNVKDAVFYDVHAEKYPIDDVVSKLDYSDTYALTFAVREAQIANLVGEGDEIDFVSGLPVTQDDQTTDRDFVDMVKFDQDGKLNIIGHRQDVYGKTVHFDHAEGMSLDGFDDLYSQIKELRKQEALEEEETDNYIQEYPQLNTFTIMEENKHEEVAQQQDAQEQQNQQKPEAQAGGEKKGWNIDYNKYSMPEGVTVEKANVFRLTSGQDAGKYAISAIINGERKVRTLYYNDVNAFFNEKKNQDGPKATVDQLVAKYFGTGKKEKEAVAPKVETEPKTNEKPQAQHAEGGEKKKPFANIDYSKYHLPEGTTVENASVFKTTKGKDVGKYAISALVNGQRQYRVLYKNDLDAYFQKDENGKPRASVEQLIAKYFGKTAESMAVGSVQEAEHLVQEQQEQKANATEQEKAKAQEAEKKQEEQKKTDEAKNKEEKKSVPASVVQAQLISGALVAAVAADGVFMNKDGKKSPDFASREHMIVSPFNAMMMALHSDVNGYKTNQYVTFDDAKSNGFSVKKGESGLSYNWYAFDKYVNRYDSNDVITKDAYEALEEDKKGLYKQFRSKEEKSIFNVDQTTMSSVKKDDYKQLLAAEDKSVVGRAVKENVDTPAEDISPIENLKANAGGAMLLLRTANNTYELHGDDAVKAGQLLGMKVTDHPDMKDGEGNAVKVVSIPKADLDTILPKIIRSGERVAIADKPESEAVLKRYGTADRIYKDMAELTESMKKAGGDNVIVSSIRETGYDRETGILHINDSRSSAPGEEVKTAISRANDLYRAIALYTGNTERLNRGGKMLPDDAVKYDRLVSELSAGVLMSRKGLPATLSTSSQSLVPYFERELKEDSKLVGRLENDVNNTVKVIGMIRKGEVVDYATIRGEKSIEAMRPKFYTIASELNTLPDMESKRVVIVKDAKEKSAAVILPAGASLEVKNEVPGMSKERIAISLKKEGIDGDKITFYNAGGSLGLNQPNEFFADKEVIVGHLKQYEIMVDETLDLKEEIARTGMVDIEQVSMIKDDANKYVLYIKPAEGKPITVYPEASDIKLFFANLRTENFDAVRENLGQKYYAFIQKYPEMEAGVLMPEIPEEVNLARITKVNIAKDKRDESRYVMFAEIDGDRVHHTVTKDQAQRLFLVDDQFLYKQRLAAVLFGEKLGIAEGQEAAQFRDNHEEQGHDNVEETRQTEAPEQEEHNEERRAGGMHR